MNQLVRIIKSDDGETYKKRTWHVIDNYGDGPRTLCGGEVFGIGESRVEYELKEAKRGITCELCREKIKYFKSVKI